MDSEKAKKVLWVCDAPQWAYEIVGKRVLGSLNDYSGDFIYKRDSDYVEKLKKGVEYDIVVCNSMEIARQFNAPCIARMGSMRVFRKQWHLQGTEDFYRWADVMNESNFFVASNFKLFGVAQRFTDRVRLIPHACDLTKFKPVKREFNEENFTVGFAGNISDSRTDDKGFYFLEEACSRLGVRLKKTVYFNEKNRAQTPNDKMPDFYNSVDCIALPSNGEGCSNVLAEALACGVPVITTASAGFHGEMLIDMRDCLLVERNAKSIMKAIMLIKKDESLRSELSKNGRAFAERFHSLEKQATAWREVFRIFEECK